MEFVAIAEGSQAPVGQIGFSRIWTKTNSAHLGPVFVDPALRGKGIGSRMVHEALTVGFEHLHLHRIELLVFDFNEAAISCYERAGFKTEGLLRDIVQVEGVYWNWKAMSILDNEWNDNGNAKD